MMKRLLNTTLSVLSLAALASPSFAQDIVVFKSNPNNVNQIAPVHLVQIAYQGFLEEQGISSGGKFIADANRGDITAETLVRSAIEKRRLSPETLNDSDYLDIVQSELDELNRS